MRCASPPWLALRRLDLPFPAIAILFLAQSFQVLSCLASLCIGRPSCSVAPGLFLAARSRSRTLLTVLAAFGGKHGPRELILKKPAEGRFDLRREPPRRGPRRSEPKGAALRRSVTPRQRDAENRVSTFQDLRKVANRCSRDCETYRFSDCFFFFRVSFSDFPRTNRFNFWALFMIIFQAGIAHARRGVKSSNSLTNLTNYFLFSSFAFVPRTSWFELRHLLCAIL